MFTKRRSKTADAVTLLTRADGYREHPPYGPSPSSVQDTRERARAPSQPQQAPSAVHSGQTLSVVARIKALRGASPGEERRGKCVISQHPKGRCESSGLCLRPCCAALMAQYQTQDCLILKQLTRPANYAQCTALAPMRQYASREIPCRSIRDNLTPHA